MSYPIPSFPLPHPAASSGAAGAPLNAAFGDTFQGVMHVFIGLFLTQGRDKDWDCGSQSGRGFRGRVRHMNGEPFTLLTIVLTAPSFRSMPARNAPASVSDSSRMSVRFILASMARMPREFCVVTTQSAWLVRADFQAYELCRRTRPCIVRDSGQSVARFRPIVRTMNTNNTKSASPCARVGAINRALRATVSVMRPTLPENAQSGCSVLGTTWLRGLR